jgi:hypothetical protein
MPRMQGKGLLLSLAGTGTVIGGAVKGIQILLHLPILPAIRFLLQLRSLPDYASVLLLGTLSPFFRLKVKSHLAAEELKSS